MEKEQIDLNAEDPAVEERSDEEAKKEEIRAWLAGYIRRVQQGMQSPSEPQN